MSAPNSPELISLPSLSSQILIKYSYKGIAISWPAEFIYEGLFPFLVDAIKVNWEITKIFPPTSINDLFIIPFSSSNILRFKTLFEIHSASVFSSSNAIPTNTSIP